MEQNITDYKIIWYSYYQLDILKLLITVLVTLNRGFLQECHKKVLKIHMLQTLILLQR